MKAVIFDMNGVIVDDESYHRLAWQEFMEEKGLKFREEEFKELVTGKSNREILNMLFKNLSESDLERYSAEKTEYAMILFEPHLKAPPGLHELFNFLKDKGLKIGLATSSRQNYTDFILDNLKIRHKFKAIVTADEVEKSKPDPEIFLECAKKLKTDPSECIVIEDSLNGIKAAKEAGMTCIGITTTLLEDDLYEADAIANSFEEIIELLKKEDFMEQDME